MNSTISRRHFLAASAGALAASALAPRVLAAEKAPPFKISLAEWSLLESIRAALAG